MKPVIMFPGQSSRYPEMIDRLFEWAPEDAAPVIGEASETLGRDLRQHFRATNDRAFAANRDVQLGVFLANHIHLCALERAGVRAELSLGLSLGEYNHLVHIGAISLADAVRLVDARGVAYDAGPPGAMAGVFPLPLEDLEEVVKQARPHGTLEIANFNSPTQHVISGSRDAIDAAAKIVDLEHGAECVMIERSIPMHCSVFKPAAVAFGPALEKAPWRTPKLPYLPNVLGHFEESPTPARICDHLARHVYSPVYFRHSIDFLVARHPDAAFIEVGPRRVLFNLLSRKWLHNPRFKTDAPEDAAANLSAAVEEIKRGS